VMSEQAGYANTCVNSQVGHRIVALRPNALIRRTLYGPTPSTDIYIHLDH